MATKALLTVEDFVRLPESVDGQDVRYELVEGELVEIFPENLRHNLVRDEVLMVLLECLECERAGTAIGHRALAEAPASCRCEDSNF